MLLGRYEPPFRVCDLYEIRQGVFTTTKDESIDYEAAIEYLHKTDKIRVLDRKTPIDETTFEPTTDFGVLKPSLPVNVPQAASAKIGSDVGMMLEAYAALYVLENNLRDFMERKLRQTYGNEWWEKGIPNSIRREVEKRKLDNRRPWHHLSVASPMALTGFPDIANIISTNWKECFEGVFRDLERVRVTLNELELPRNIIAHCNPLTEDEKSHFMVNTNTVLKMISTA